MSLFTDRFYAPFDGLRPKAIHFRCASQQLLHKAGHRNWYAIISPAAVIFFWGITILTCRRALASPTRRVITLSSHERSDFPSRSGCQPAIGSWSVQERVETPNLFAAALFTEPAVVFFVFLFTFRLPSWILRNIQSKLFVERGIVSFSFVHNYCFNFFSVSRSPLPPRAEKFKKDWLAQFNSIFQFKRFKNRSVRAERRDFIATGSERVALTQIESELRGKRARIVWKLPNTGI